MIYYMLPDFMLGDKAYTVLVSLLENAPNTLYPNQAIQFIYGCPANAIWNGGSVLCSERFFLIDEMKQIIHYYNDTLQLPIAWTFTNPLLTETDCYDRYCNLLAESGHNGMNYILVTSPILEKYLREKYPNYYYCKSILSVEGLQNYENDYAFTVLERKRNNDFEFLRSIPDHIKPKIEILTNDYCDPDCPYIYSHYLNFAQSQLAFEIGDKKLLDCHYKQSKEGNPLVLSKTQIDNIYVPMGFTHFKLSGRTSVEMIVDNIMEYFVLPEYQEIIGREIHGFISG